MYCVSCGIANPDHARFCHACGTTIQHQPPVTVSTPPRSQSSSTSSPPSDVASPAPELSRLSPTQTAAMPPSADDHSVPSRPATAARRQKAAPPVPDGSVCTDHSTEWAVQACLRCRKRYCAACVADFDGHGACRQCTAAERQRQAQGVSTFFHPQTDDPGYQANLALLLSILGIFTCGILEFWAYAKAKQALIDLTDSPLEAAARAKATAAIWIARIVFLLVIVSAFSNVLIESFSRI